MSEAFNSPRLAINRVYTKRGDTGETSLVGGQRVPKDNLRIEAYGTVDELNSFVGLARESSADIPRLGAILLRVQHELFNLGSILATLPEDVHPRQPRVTAVETEQLEAEMDEMNEMLPPLRSFVLPGGSRLNAELHVCRTVCRRVERILVALSSVSRSSIAPSPVALTSVALTSQNIIEDAATADALKYVNRLSDAFFVWSRWATHQLGNRETLWEPNQASSQARP